MPWPDLGTIALVAATALLLAGALAPLETLGWWAGWFGDAVEDAEGDAANVGDGADGAGVAVWVVYLSGIHAVDTEGYVASEANLLDGLRRRLPAGRVLQVFPYSVTDRALTGERVFAGVWRLALRAKLDHRRLAQAAGFVINLRNFWQVLVSADRRYGPFYNRGSAELIVRALRRQGHDPSRASRVVLVGYSGGAQVALGAAPFVQEATSSAVTVVSLGGVMSADPGVLEAEATWHLYGRRDRVQRWSAWAFPGRWRLLPWSPWNVARQRGTLRALAIGPCDHTGSEGYLDDEAHVPDGRSYFDVTADVVAAIADGGRADLPIAR
jgi:hypothetical protein